MPSLSVNSQQDLARYLALPFDQGPPDLMALQSASLQELLRLSSGWAGSAIDWIQSRYQGLRRQLEDHLQAQMKELQGQFAPLRQQLDLDLKAQIDQLNEQYRQKRRILDQQFRQRQEDLVKSSNHRKGIIETRHRDRLMELDFLLEGMLEQAKRRQRLIQQTRQRLQQRLDQIQSQAQAAFGDSRRPQSPPDLKDVKPAGPPGTVWRKQVASALEYLNLLTRPWYAKVLARLTFKASHQDALSIYKALCQALAMASAALDQRYRNAIARIQASYGRRIESTKASRRKAEQFHQKALEQIRNELDRSLVQLQSQHQQAIQGLDSEHKQALELSQQRYSRQSAELDQRYQQQLQQIRTQYHHQLDQIEQQYRQGLDDTTTRWHRALECINSYRTAVSSLDPRAESPLDQVLDRWQPPRLTPSAIRFGRWPIDDNWYAQQVIRHLGKDSLPSYLPAILRIPGGCSLLVEHDRAGRGQAIDLIRAVMARLFVALPPGMAVFTIVDPIGLGQSFAGFMHAADYSQGIVGGRIWTEAAEIQRQLEEITNHMENVIQKYLRNEFQTIEQYNQQAGQLAEPYRFLVIADFPNHINDESARRLASIAHSGPRCGVHTLIAWDSRQQPPEPLDIKDLASSSLHLVYKQDRFTCKTIGQGQFWLDPDRPLEERSLTSLMRSVGRAGMQAAKVEVPFESIAPSDQQIWSMDSIDGLVVPIGRAGATRLQYLKLGQGVAQHMLIAGKTGSGKSTLLHVIITSLGLCYGPDQVELYLIDFKKGVEFKTYVTHQLPHARAIAVESDREFGLSILQNLLAEMSRRGELFRKSQVQDIAAYRRSTDRPLPRIVLIVDEFQVFFAEDDKLAQDAAIALEQLVRQGRAFGIHVILGSQTLGGAFGLARSTMGQMAVRIALQCSEADSQLILDDENIAARRLSRPGEAIYNDSGGAVAGNSPFQIAWLPEQVRDIYLQKIQGKATGPGRPVVVFEGNAPADVSENLVLSDWLHHGSTIKPTNRITLWLGSPVAIKEPTAAILARQVGANVLIVGQREDLAMNMMICTLISLAAQVGLEGARCMILDGSPSGSEPYRLLRRAIELTGIRPRLISRRQVQRAFSELAMIAKQRTESEAAASEEPILVLIYALQRYAALRKTEDEFGLQPAGQQDRTDQQFRDLLQAGPSVGIHLVVWADTLATVERTIDRHTLREFDWRVLFQMSAADSSNLIDSPIANQLGYHRAILYSHEQGTMEKFRPYALITEDWLTKVGSFLKKGHSDKG